MFYTILNTFPIWKNTSSKKRNSRIILIGTSLYVILFSYVYSNYGVNNEILMKHKNKLKYLIFLDLGLFLSKSKKENLKYHGGMPIGSFNILNSNMQRIPSHIQHSQNMQQLPPHLQRPLLPQHYQKMDENNINLSQQRLSQGQGIPQGQYQLHQRSLPGQDQGQQRLLSSQCVSPQGQNQNQDQCVPPPGQGQSNSQNLNKPLNILPAQIQLPTTPPTMSISGNQDKFDIPIYDPE